jgi:outer membrane receptor for ferrienterochelin and colicins
VFALKEIGYENGVLIKERHNESGARVFGGNLEAKVAWKDVLQIQFGLTAQDSKYKEARSWSDDVEATRAMFRTPNLYGYWTASYSPIKPLSIAFTGTYTGSMLIEHHAGMIAENRTEKTPDFWDMGLKAAYDLRIYKSFTLQLNVGVQNILNSFQKDFDFGPDRDSGYIYGPTLPRSFYFGIKLMY